MSEYWVDVPKIEIPAPSTWANLTLNQLLEVKNQLLDKQYMVRGKPQYLGPLNQAMAKLEAIIAQKMADPRGSL